MPGKQHMPKCFCHWTYGLCESQDLNHVHAEVQRGKGRIPVADYRLAADVLPEWSNIAPSTVQQAAQRLGAAAAANSEPQAAQPHAGTSQTENSAAAAAMVADGRRSSDPLAPTGTAPLPGRDGSAASAQEHQADTASRQALGREGSAPQQKQPGPSDSHSLAKRGVYSFCMCPGGQIVCTSTSSSELCINGMSFRSASGAFKAASEASKRLPCSPLSVHGTLQTSCSGQTCCSHSPPGPSSDLHARPTTQPCQQKSGVSAGLTAAGPVARSPCMCQAAGTAASCPCMC